MNAEQNNQPPHQVRMASAGQEFMTRTDLKGREVEAYAQTFNWLEELRREELLVVGKDHMDALLEEKKDNTEALSKYLELYGPLEDESTPDPDADVILVDSEGVPVLEPVVEELDPVTSEASD